MLADLKAQALLVTDCVHTEHIGSGETLIHRIHKYYEADYVPGIAIFIDSAEGELDDEDTSNVRQTFDLGFTALVKAELYDYVAIDHAWNNTNKALIEYVGILKHLQFDREDEFEINIAKKFAQVGKIVNADVYGWRVDARITFNVNSIYCTH